MAVTITDCWPCGIYRRSAPMQIAIRHERLTRTSRSFPLKISCFPVNLSLSCRCKGGWVSTVMSLFIDVLLATGVTMHEAMNPRVFKRACCSLPRTSSTVPSHLRWHPSCGGSPALFFRGSGDDGSLGLGPHNLEEIPQVTLKPELYIAIQHTDEVA